VICASLLTKESVQINNIPDIQDVQNLIAILKGIGVKIKRHNINDYTFNAEIIDLTF